MRLRVSLSILTVAVVWAAAGCSTPWGPGYTIEKQRIEVTYTKEKPDRVSVRAWYQLRNTGKVPLATISVEIPYLPQFTENVRADWNSTTLQSLAVPDDEHQMQFTLGSSWKPTERGEFVVTYGLRVVYPEHPLVAGGGAPFFLPSKDWYPVLVPPSGTFSEPNPPPNKWDLVISVPQGYHVYASGRVGGADRSSKRNAAAAPTLRFEQRPLIDFNPFVAAGSYVEQQVKTSNGTVTLWSAMPVPDKRVREISERVSTDAKYLSTEFGLRELRNMPVWIIECPLLDPPKPSIIFEKGCQPEPRAAIVAEVFFGSRATEVMDMSVDYSLAKTWFQLSISASQGDPPWPLEAAWAYAGDAAIASHDENYRERLVRGLLPTRKNSYANRSEAPLLSVKRQDQELTKEEAFVHSRLFFFALEDRCGEKNVHRALARILRIQRGSTWNISDLRSAMEAECGGADLADFFREWLNKPGIPEEFRTRYSGAAPAKPPGPSH
jgi:hypothetical protein